MVAITVILAAVIGTFVLGLSDQVGETTPRAQFGTSAGNIGDGDLDNDEVTITHESGDSIDPANLKITVGDDTVYDDGATVSGTNYGATASFGDPITAGDSLTAYETNSGTSEWGSETTVRVIWESPGSDSTSTLVKKNFDADS